MILSKEDCGDSQKPTEQPDDRIGHFCPESQVLDTYEINGELWHLMQGRCNRWSCEVCGPEKTRDLCRRIEAARPNRFITLTCGRPAGRSPREVWDDTRRQVPELIRRIRNEVGSIEYCRVMEEHKSGYPHFHLIVRSPYIEQQTLARWWCDLTDAFIVDIRRIDPDRRVARYVAKYLCKTYASTISDRRVTNSKEFFPPKPTAEQSDYCFTEMRRERGTIRDYLSRYFPDAEVEWLNRSHVIIESRGSTNAPGSSVMRDRDGQPIHHGSHRWHQEEPF